MLQNRCADRFCGGEQQGGDPESAAYLPHDPVGRALAGPHEESWQVLHEPMPLVEAAGSNASAKTPPTWHTFEVNGLRGL